MANNVSLQLVKAIYGDHSPEYLIASANQIALETGSFLSLDGDDDLASVTIHEVPERFYDIDPRDIDPEHRELAGFYIPDEEMDSGFEERQYLGGAESGEFQVTPEEGWPELETDDDNYNEYPEEQEGYYFRVDDYSHSMDLFDGANDGY